MKLSYQEKQHELFERLEAEFRKNRNAAEIIEPVSDYAGDNRIFLAVIVFPPDTIIRSIQDKIFDKFKNIDNRQYFYFPESLHFTIQNIRTINDPPTFDQTDIEKSKKVLSETIAGHNNFPVSLKGLFETPTSFSIRGYCDERLHSLITDIRAEMKNIGLKDNKKYASEEVFFGNITVCRYTQKPTDGFFSVVKKLKEVEIGEFLIERVSLITSNAVAHPGKTKILAEYSLGL